MSATMPTISPLTISRSARWMPPWSMPSPLSFSPTTSAEHLLIEHDLFGKPLHTFPDHALKRFTFEKPWHLTRKAGGLADEHALQRRRAIDQTQADIAHGAQPRRFVGEQEIERVGRKAHRHGVEPPPALIAFEHVDLTGIDAKTGRIDDDFG